MPRASLRSLLLICADSAAFICRVSTQITGKPASANALYSHCVGSRLKTNALNGKRFHHIDTELLEEAFYELARNAAPGVDRLTWKDYEADLERNIEDLHDR